MEPQINSQTQQTSVPTPVIPPQEIIQPVAKHFSHTKLAAIVLLIGIVPALAFYVGKQHESAVQVIQNPIVENTTVQEIQNPIAENTVDQTTEVNETQKSTAQATPEVVQPQNYTHQKAAMSAALSTLRAEAEVKYAMNNSSYVGVCLSAEAYLVAKYNERSSDQNLGVKFYSPISQINNFNCVDSQEKYAVSIPIRQSNGAEIITCIDSSGSFKPGTFESSTMMCSN